MRPYFTLLRLTYQLQLGPIFAWGYLLAGGRLHTVHSVIHYAAVFLVFHVGAFGGLTALNSFYDRDTGPVGGLWQPPPPPARLLGFAWCVQLCGLLLLAPLNPLVAGLYAAILALSLGYSHPRTRWKGHAWQSLATVTAGQGMLDYLAGACTANGTLWGGPLWYGLAGASVTVAGFYPLTQLYQVADDAGRGDRTLAATLVAWGGRAAVFRWAVALLIAGTVCNALALLQAGHVGDAALVGMAGAGTAVGVRWWSLQKADSTRSDFLRIHWLMRCTAAAFGAYILARLVMGGIY